MKRTPQNLVHAPEARRHTFVPHLADGEAEDPPFLVSHAAGIMDDYYDTLVADCVAIERRAKRRRDPRA